jgi:hypothetical protein
MASALRPLLVLAAVVAVTPVMLGQQPNLGYGATLVSPATVTVVHNGIVVQNAQTFWGQTQHRRIDPYVPSNARGPLRLQDHGNPIRYRNVWVRRIETSG